MSTKAEPRVPSRAGATPGRILLSLVAITTSTGCYVADWNTTHVFNPRWPPHAKFHNGQTMSMGMGLGLATAYYTWRRGYDEDSLRTACLFGSLYWVTQLSAICYPGTLMIDPEFGTGHPQVYVVAAMLGSVGLAWWLESKRMAEHKEGNKVE